MANSDSPQSTTVSYKGASPALLRRINVRTILDTLSRNGPRTRAELTRSTGISPPTVSKLMQQLEDLGWVEADPEPVVTNGRPGVRFRFARQRARVVGVAVDVRYTLVTDSGLDGIPDDEEIRFETPANYQDLLDRVEQAIRELQQRNPQSRTLCTSVSIPGLVDSYTGRILVSPNLHQLDGCPLSADLEARIGTPTFIDQEMTALSLGILREKGEEAPDHLVSIDAIEGLGCGVLINRTPFLGRNGFAGELGHITIDPDGKECGCGNQGCLETVASDSALARAIGERIGRELTIDDLLEEVHAGRIDPEPELETAIQALGIGIGAAMNLYNPEAVYLACRLTELKPDVLDRIQAAARRRALGPCAEDTPIELTQMDKGRAVLAAAIQHVTSGVGPLVSNA